MEPSSLPLRTYTKSQTKHANPQAQLPTIECPTGEIPIIRNKRTDSMAVKTIDEIVSKDVQQEVSILFFKIVLE